MDGSPKAKRFLKEVQNLTVSSFTTNYHLPFTYNPSEQSWIFSYFACVCLSSAASIRLCFKPYRIQFSKILVCQHADKSFSCRTKTFLDNIFQSSTNRKQFLTFFGNQNGQFKNNKSHKLHVFFTIRGYTKYF